ncbi:IncP-type conjugal transfer protein TrbI [Rhizobium cauense]|uniref:IncP-type conjugal transfer protein TrbI n=1 Tax=Rhizobium cauense TaxID=1166683 RepID=UPI003B831FD5
MRRLNRLPILICIFVALAFFGVVVIGLSWRGMHFSDSGDNGSASGTPATNFGDRLKQGVADGIIGEQDGRRPLEAAKVPEQVQIGDEKPALAPQRIDRIERRLQMDSEKEWRARLQREQDEQFVREVHRQRMARLQAQATALDSPLTVDISQHDRPSNDAGKEQVRTLAPSDLYAAAGQSFDPNEQGSKERFFNQDIEELGYLPARLNGGLSRFELKRGSVIPATLITGINSDLPGRISAQVSQNVFDTATGHRLLIPQGAKLFGRYDSKVSFGQSRVLVVWTDIIFPDGSTLQIGGMAGTDMAGYGGFKDQVDRHLWRTFGSAALVAIIGTGIDLSLPEPSTRATQDTASDAARRNFAESFGRVTEQVISKNLNVQPTVQIRPGYKFNVLVDQDMIFPKAYSEPY